MSPYKMIGGFIAVLSVIGVSTASEMRWFLGICLGVVNALVWGWPHYSKWQKKRGHLRIEGQRQLDAGNYAEAERLLVAAAQQMQGRRVAPGEHIALLCDIGTAQIKLNKLADAETLIQAALAQAQGADRARVLSLQADFFRASGNAAGAIAALRESIEFEKAQNQSSPSVIATRTLALANAAAESGSADTVALFAEAADLHVKALGPSHEKTAEALASHGAALLRSGDAVSAVTVLQRAQSAFAAADAVYTRSSIGATQHLAKAYLASSQPYEAVDTYEAMLSRMDRVAGVPSEDTAAARLEAGRAYLTAARYGPALESIEQALRVFEQSEHRLLASCLAAHGAALEKFGRYADAGASLGRAIEMWDRAGALASPEAREAIDRHAALSGNGSLRGALD